MLKAPSHHYTLKSNILIPNISMKREGEIERYFTAIATSQIVDSQKEMIDVDHLKSSLPMIQERGMAVNLGHFGVNVGYSNDVELTTFGELIDKYKSDPRIVKALSKYKSDTLAVVAKGKINYGNAFDDLAWEMLQNGDINGVSIGMQLEDEGVYECDTMRCGIKKRVKGAFFELALTGKDLTFPINSENPSNPTTIILDLKAQLKAKNFKEEEHKRDGGKFSKMQGSGKKKKEKKGKKREKDFGDKPWKKKKEKGPKKISERDEQINLINDKYSKLAKETPKFENTPKDSNEYNSNKPWKNSARYKQMVHEDGLREARLQELGNSDKPWKNRITSEQISAFKEDISNLTTEMNVLDKQEAKVEHEIKKFVKSNKGEHNEKKAKHVQKLMKKRQQIKKNKQTVKYKRDQSREALSAIADAGKDLRKFLASKMGLPDVQIDKIAKLIANEQEKSSTKSQILAKIKNEVFLPMSMKTIEKNKLSIKSKKDLERKKERILKRIVKVSLTDPKKANKYLEKYDNLYTKSDNEKSIHLKRHMSNADGMASNSQDSYPPQEGEYSIAQVLKIVGDLGKRVTNMEQVNSATPAIIPQDPQPQEIQPQESQVEQFAENVKEDVSDDVEEEVEEEIEEEIKDSNENDMSDESKDDDDFEFEDDEKDDDDFFSDDDEEESEEMDADDIEKKKETKAYGDVPVSVMRDVNDQMDELGEAMDEMYNPDDMSRPKEGKNYKEPQVSIATKMADHNLDDASEIEYEADMKEYKSYDSSTKNTEMKTHEMKNDMSSKHDYHESSESEEMMASKAKDYHTSTTDNPNASLKKDYHTSTEDYPKMKACDCHQSTEDIDNPDYKACMNDEHQSTEDEEYENHSMKGEYSESQTHLDDENGDQTNMSQKAEEGCNCNKKQPVKKVKEQISTKSEVVEAPVTITMDQLTEALANQRKEMYAELGIKSVQTPISTVDASQNKGGQGQNSGKTLGEMIQATVKEFSDESGMPNLKVLEDSLFNNQ